MPNRGAARRKKAMKKETIEAHCSSTNKEAEVEEVEGANNIDDDTGVIEPMLDEEIPDKYLMFVGEVIVEISDVAIRIWRDTDCYFHGKVCVGLSHPLFHRQKENPAKLPYYGGGLTLTGPQYALQGTDRLIFEVDLWEGERSLIQGFARWIGLYTVEGTRQLDEPLSVEIEGSGNASVVITYVVYSCAVVATLEMKLMGFSSKTGTDNLNFYGSIFVNNSKFPDILSRIFRNKEDEPIQLRSGDLIPLSRSVIAVPLGTLLQFLAHVPLLSTDVMFCEFNARKHCGVSVGKLTGEYGAIEVSITWEKLSSHYRRRLGHF